MTKKTRRNRKATRSVRRTQVPTVSIPEVNVNIAESITTGLKPLVDAINVLKAEYNI